MTLLSICIPVYEMPVNSNPPREEGLAMLAENFKQLEKQKFKDFNVIISDNSQNKTIETYVKGIKKLNVKYTRNEGAKTMASNMNNAIKNADGEIIHIMCQDDFFYNADSLQKIIDNFEKEKGWMVSRYMHSKDRLGLFKRQTPSWNDKMYLNNSIGTPSCLSFVNDDPLLFDENLNWFIDCELYFRLFKRYGLPKVLDDTIFIQYLWEGQLTTRMTQEEIDKETLYIKQIYEPPIVATGKK